MFVFISKNKYYVLCEMLKFKAFGLVMSFESKEEHLLIHLLGYLNSNLMFRRDSPFKYDL